jgi:spore maturation protein CgeB
MKLARITTLNPSYIKYLYDRNAELASIPYVEQQTKIHFDGYGWADFWTNALKPFGIEVREIEMNVRQLQMNWAREKNIMFHAKKWMYEITEAQLKEFKPDILFIHDIRGTTAPWIKKIRTGIPSIKMIIGWYGAPIFDTSVIKECDLMLSCIPEVVSQFRSDGMKAYHLNHSFDPRILGRIDRTASPSIEVSFVGQIIRSNRFHLEREKLLLELLNHIDIKIYSPSATIPFKKKLMVPVRYIAYYLIQLLMQMSVPELVFQKIPVLRNAAILHEKPLAFVNPLLKPYLNKDVYGLEMFQILHNSMITWNNHIDISKNSSSNMRLFEATGVGTCLLTDWKDNLPDIFEPNLEVVAYHSAEDCIEKVQWLLEHPKEREAIASAGQKRTLRNHTFTKRAEELDRIIKMELK